MDTTPRIVQYKTHDNRARPFTVEVRIHEKAADPFSACIADVTVWENDLVLDKWTRKTVETLAYSRARVWIGVSPRTPMTEFSGGHGEKFDGSAFVIQPDLDVSAYVYVGDEILRFSTRDALVRFVSPVGNNLVVYSYAVDTAQRHYLFLEEIILDKCHLHARYSDDPARFCPHDYYYNREGEWYAPLDVVWYSECDDLDADGLPEEYHLHMLSDMSDEAGVKRVYWRMSKDGKSKVPLTHQAAATILRAANERCGVLPLQGRVLSPRFHVRVANGA